MSYALRNSLILGVLLCVVWGAGYYWVEVRQERAIQALQERRQKLDEELEIAALALAIYDTTLAQLNSMEARWQDRRRFVPLLDTAGRTLIYFDELLKAVDGDIGYDFLFRGRKDEQRYSVNVYGLEGRAKFDKLYAFIWHLEHGPRFYTVDRLQIDYQEPEAGQRLPAADEVKFSLVLRAFFNPHSPLADSIPRPGAEQPARLAGNPFDPLITRTLPPNHLGLLEVESARLKGLTHEVVYLQDARGRLHMLRPGERVYLGRLDKIDIIENRAEFVLNKGGIWERFILRF